MSTHDLRFRAKIRENVYPCKPQLYYMSRDMIKTDFHICENKATDQLWGNHTTVTAQLISAFVFATWIVQFLYFLNPKF